jgi:hypothetical protein
MNKTVGAILLTNKNLERSKNWTDSELSNLSSVVMCPELEPGAQGFVNLMLIVHPYRTVSNPIGTAPQPPH